MADLEANLKNVKRRIESAAAAAGRDPAEITLVAVSKTRPPEAVLAAYALGLRQFGENRVEEAIGKIPAVRLGLPENGSRASSIHWHMIGHLQSRKVRDAVSLFDLIHSVDSVELARHISDRAGRLGKRMPILLEVNVSGEVQKFGLSPQSRGDFFAAVGEIVRLDNLDVQGLMTMAPIVDQAEEARVFFRTLRELRDELRVRFPEQTWRHLSMGMTDDLEAAVSEGATMVRIGRAIFGERE